MFFTEDACDQKRYDMSSLILIYKSLSTRISEEMFIVSGVFTPENYGGVDRIDGGFVKVDCITVS